MQYMSKGKQKMLALQCLLLCATILFGAAACNTTATDSGAASSQPTSAAASSTLPPSSQATVSSTPVSSTPVSSTPVSSAPVSSAPVSSKPAVSKPITTTLTLEQETTPSGHYNNTVNVFNSGNVTVCGDYALEIVGGGSAAVKQSYAAAVNTLVKKYPSLNVICAIIPKSSAFNHPDKYANQYNVQQKSIADSYALMNDSVITVDVFGEMAAHKGEYMFYRTDHHWNGLGAYYASVAYGKALGIETRALSSYKTVTTSGYVGSLYTFCASPKPQCLRQNPDVTVGRLPNAEYTLTYTYNGAQYKGTAINARNGGYMMFLSGDFPLIHIKTSNTTGRKLLVFKESYGNAFVPYMIDYYDEIVVVDIRQKTPTTSKLIADYGITDVLVINNVQAANNGSQIKQLAAKTAS